jgi:phospholipase/carboxylesterase
MPSRRRDDLPLTYVIDVPSEKTGELPMVICMHGRGADAYDLADLAPLIDQGTGIRFLFPNAPKPFEPMPGYTFGFTWFDDWPPERTSLAASRTILLDFIDQAVAKYPTPSGKLVLAGFSQGALMALDAAFRTTQQLCGVVAMSGALSEDELPDLRLHRHQRILIIHGEYDDVIPPFSARRTRLVLEDHGIQPEYYELPMAHQITQESIDIAGGFIRGCLA